MSKPTLDITIKGYNDLVKYSKDIEKKSALVIKRTVSDFKARAPGWVSQEVTKEYNIKKGEVNKSKKGIGKGTKAKLAGKVIDNVTISYKGNPLTPTHFNMRPGVRPTGGRGYRVTAEIKKGVRKSLGNNVFLGQTKTGNKQLPFQRQGKERYPINIIKTVSVPQMITNEKVAERINKRVNDELNKRFMNHMKQLMRK